MSKDELKKILNDIYRIDESLKEREKDLIKIVQEIIKSKPQISYNEEFAKELRLNLLKELENKKFDNKNIFNFNFMNLNKLQYALGGGVLVTILALAIFINFPLSFNSSGNDDLANKFSFSPKITKVENNAFGELSAQESQEGEARAMNTLGLGAGGGVDQLSESASSEAVINMASPDMKIMPVPYSYKYKYVGEDFSLDSQVEVLKRVKNSDASKALFSAFAGKKIGPIDLGVFNNLGLENINIFEDREYGYQISFNLKEGTFSINENWEKWRNLEMEKCRDDACYQSFRLKINDIPSDNQLLEIANNFLREKRIDVSAYGNPEVENTFREQYDNAADKSNFYIPEVISVVYPLLIDGEEVMDESGNKNGIRVNVNVRVNRVSGLYGLSIQNYESSSYEGETDAQKIIEIAERGGQRWYFYEAENQIELELGTPERTLVNIWNYRDGQSEELLVPALIFPILNPPTEQYYYRKNVVVPLAQDILKRYEVNEDIMPMPLLKDGLGSDGSEGSEPEIMPVNIKEELPEARNDLLIQVENDFEEVMLEDNRESIIRE